MTRVTDYGELSARLGQLLFAGGVTNGLPKSEAIRREIAAGTLFREDLPGGILLLRQRADHMLLNFMLEDPAALAGWVPEESTVLELPRRDRDAVLSALGEGLIGRGWMPLLRRIRLTRRPGPLSPEASASAGEDLLPKDPAESLRILTRCFSPLTGCLPDPEDLAAEETVRLPGGVLHYQKKGNTTELRHLAVLPEYRRQGLGRRLTTAYLELEGQSLSRVWTGADNEPALRLYRDFGYLPDGWSSLVLYYLKT